mgnify:FL=1
MKKFFIFIIFFFPINSFSNEKIINSLKDGKKIVFIRHAIAPGNGDPDNFDITDCSTQRNLNDKGRAQSKIIGEFFKSNKILFDKVLTSEWCRCKDTGIIAFGDIETFSALNSFYDQRFAKNKDKQIQNLKKYIKNWKSKKNLILITHYVVILEILNLGTSSGEIIISNKNFELIGNIKTM